MNDCFQRLRKEISKFLKQSEIAGGNQKSIVDNFQEKSLGLEKLKQNSVENWSETDVKEWFVKNNMNLAILDHLFPCSGIVLQQIYDMKKTAPEFFYQSLKEIKGLSLSSISLFTHFLLKLCEEGK